MTPGAHGAIFPPHLAYAAARGAALPAGVGAGLWPDLAAALQSPAARRIDPEPDWAATCDRLHAAAYRHLHGALAPVNRARADS